MDEKETAEGLLKKLAEADNKVATKTGELKQAQEEYGAIEDRLFKLMDDLGTECVRNAKIGLQVSISETDVDTIEDYTKLVAFLKRHNLIHFLQRRLSPVAIREYKQANPKRTIPGLGSFRKRRLHVTSISK